MRLGKVGQTVGQKAYEKLMTILNDTLCLSTTEIGTVCSVNHCNELVLVLSGYYDSQVQYWEPLKWVAKLREYKIDDNLLLLNMNMESGHSGSTGRFKIYKEIALEYAFLFKLENINI